MLSTTSIWTKFRADTFYTKEPKTVEWIDTTFTSSSVLWDVGANVGIYSIYAAACYPEVQVVTFEPEALNFASLNRNIHLNKFWDRITPFQVAVGEGQPRLIEFILSHFQEGVGSHSLVAVPGSPTKRKVMLWSLDGIYHTFQMPSPTHLKVDVEMGEMSVLSGAVDLLSSRTLKHLVIEVKLRDELNKLNEFLRKFGFVYLYRDVHEPNLFYSKVL